MSRLRRLDIRLAVEGDRLSISAPAGALPDDLRQEMAARKAEIVAFLRDQHDRHDTGLVLDKAPAGVPIPLSFAQQRLWFLAQLDPADTAYNLGASIEVDPALPEVVLREAVRLVAARHDMLRTVFQANQGVPSQRVTDRLPELSVELVEPGDPATAIPEVARRGYAAVATKFQLELEPAFRATLIRGPGIAKLVLAIHHIVADGWSLGILAKEVREVIEALGQGRVPRPDPSRWQYGDYAFSLNNWFATANQSDHVRYWRHKLGGDLAPLNLPVDRPRARVLTSAANLVPFALSPDLSSKLRTLTNALGGTLFTTLLGLYSILLHRYSGQSDLLVGTPIANRDLAELEPLIGLFVSTSVLRADLTGDPSFRETELRLRRTLLEAYEHRAYPFEKIVELVRPDRSLARSPLVQVAFVFQNTPLAGTFEAIGAGSVYELSLYLWDTGTDIQGAFEFNSGLFETATIRRMAEHFQCLAQAVIERAEAPISDLPVLGDTERAMITEAWNATTSAYPRDDSIVGLFERQVDRAPDAIAIERPDGERGPATLSYRELDRRANQLAHVLVGRGVGPGSPVGLMLERSSDFIVAALATLKTGAAYIPIDPELPADRRAQLVRATDAQVFLVHGEAGSLGGRDAIDLEHLDQTLAGAPTDRLGLAILPMVPAYLMFTSGTTGEPKGVVVPHRAVVRLVSNANYVSLSPDETILAAAPVSFDASTFEIWGALLNGGRLVVYPASIPEPAELARLIAHHRVTTLWLTAGLFHLMVDTQLEALGGLRQLLAGGDVLSPIQARRALGALAPRGGVLINGYGPTENTTFSCCHRMTREADVGDTVPIGRPISNSQAFVLDASLRPVPIGVTGELWVAGDGLALGYANDPELTAQRFRPNPFAADPHAKMYRTGDLARYRDDGVLEFFGRVDQQIKIRGFRVEPGEIEAALRRHPGVIATAVVAKEVAPGDRRLLAYAVFEPGGDASTNGVLRQLRETLPEYAVPSHLVALPAIPLTANGKLDVAALPLPLLDQAGTRVAPDGLEAQILVIWERVLGQNIGLSDNFFELGGNSLMGLRLLSQLEKALGRRIPASVLYQGQTVETMAAVLRTDTEVGSLRTIAVQIGDSRPPLFIVPGINGNVIGYHGLARGLGPDQTIWGLRSVGLEGEAKPLESVAAIATSIVPEIRRVQPKGPYQIIGFCMGGLVAYEVAQQLTAAGETVRLLGLLDSWSPELIPDRAPVGRFGQQVRFVLGRAVMYLRELARLPLRRWGGYLRTKAGVLGQVVSQRDLYRGDRFVLYREMVAAANQRAAARYRPKPYPGRVLLVLSSERGPRTGADPRLIWTELAESAHPVVGIPALDSGLMLKPPYVDELAAAIAPHLGPERQDP